MTTYYAYPGVENLIGGAGDDQFVIASGTLDAGDRFTGGSGLDTLVLQSDRSELYLTTISSIEALQFTNPTGDFNNRQTAYIYDSQFGAGLSNALTLYVPQAGSYYITVGVTGANFSAAAWAPDPAGSGHFSLLLIAGSGANTTLAGVTWAPNTIWGNSGNNTLIGGDFADTFVGRFGGVNTFRGGKGDDEYNVQSYSDSAIELAGGGIDTLNTYDMPGYTLPANVENLSVFFDVVHYFHYVGIGNALDNRFVGAGLDARFYGLVGDDEFHGYGTNVFTGGQGADRFYAEATNPASDGAANLVADFNRSEGDEIYISKSGWRSFYDILDASSDSAGGVIIRLDAKSSIQLQGVSRAQLKPTDFSLNGLLPFLQVPGDFTADNIADVMWERVPAI